MCWVCCGYFQFPVSRAGVSSAGGSKESPGQRGEHLGIPVRPAFFRVDGQLTWLGQQTLPQDDGHRPTFWILEQAASWQEAVSSAHTW